MNIKSVFFNESERLRSGLRFMIFALSYVLGTGFLLFFSVVISSRLNGDSELRETPFFVLQMIVSAVTAVFFGWFYGKIFEDLPFRALGCWLTKNWLKDLSFGFGLGAVSFAFAALIAFVAGGLSFQLDRTFDSSAILMTLLSSLGIFIVGAINEEVIFRGYLLQTLARAKLAWVAIILTSVFFASAHLGNPNANLISTTNTALAGIWLGAAYLKTRNLWFPFGIHLAWNWFQGAIFGVEVSGLNQYTTAPLLQEIDSGPAWLTGAAYGIEAGIACTAALIFSIAVIYFLPNLQPTEEMITLTSEEKPRNTKIPESA